ncbi:MAG: hypothetical protein HY904_23960 [Deltaproteobacteria bacterium]|nr:hypothetical protein [Deltaproteobacteria bacterium]
MGPVRGISRVASATTAALRAAYAVGAGDNVSAVRAQEAARAQMNALGSAGGASRAQLGVTFAQVLGGVAGTTPSSFDPALVTARLQMERRAQESHLMLMERRGADLERHADDVRDRVEAALESDGNPVPVRPSLVADPRSEPSLLSAGEQPVALLPPHVEA